MQISDASLLASAIAAGLVVLNIAVRLLALGVIPENRRPSSGAAWLMLILFTPLLGLLGFGLLGRTSVGETRLKRQAHALELVRERVASRRDLELPADVPLYLAPALRLSRRLGALPAVPSGPVTVFSDYDEFVRSMTLAVEQARLRVHVEFYIMAWDDTTARFFEALVAATERGVDVRLLCDHIGSRGLPSYKQLVERLDGSDIDWRPMLPFNPLRGQLRRPDLRNHRKIMVVDESVGFAGSQNLVEPWYHDEGNRKIGRSWVELTARVDGPLARSLDAVFATDWYTETGELLEVAQEAAQEAAQQGPEPDQRLDAEGSLGQVVPSGPGVVAENNLRLFTTLIYGAARRISITSPYFVPDESLLYAVTTAAQRGVEVELFVSEEGDQFMVHHAQCSYYQALLEAGVAIWLYPAPKVLHAKHLSIDDDVAVLGSSNMDMRSFALNYEVSLLLHGASAVAQVRAVEDTYRGLSRRLTLEEWQARPWRRRYLDNVMRLTAALQ